MATPRKIYIARGKKAKIVNRLETLELECFFVDDGKTGDDEFILFDSSKNFEMIVPFNSCEKVEDELVKVKFENIPANKIYSLFLDTNSDDQPGIFIFQDLSVDQIEEYFGDEDED